MTHYRLPAEWEPQSAVLLTWPHADTDWQWILADAQRVYLDIAFHSARFSRVLIAAPGQLHSSIVTALNARGVPLGQVRLCAASSNDTWARDHGPITVATADGLRLLDFIFNGWGGKFESALDNQLSASLAAEGAFNAPLQPVAMVLEGGAIESDGQGTLLTTESCLLNSNRNPELSRADIEQKLMALLGVSKINWLKHGYLEGDDTDSHIDTLARLCPLRRIAYIKCDDPADPHFAELAAMEQELEELTDAAGEPYELIALPWPAAKFSAEGERLPATYANFLILNGAVLVPTYRDAKDADALAQVQLAFPGFEVI
ncbi:MAG TPA: agmatine deiminase family protein, partial [Cellvibrionaceae bacterium]